MAVPTILVCTVGGSPRPVITACLDNAPAFVFFICSAGEARYASCVGITEAVAWDYSRRCPDCGTAHPCEVKQKPLASLADLDVDQFQIHGVVDPDDLGDLLAACASIDAEIDRRWPDRAVRVIANYTGGTKTMALALGQFAVQVDWELQVCTNPEPGRPNLRGIEVGEVPVAQDAAVVYVRAALERARLLRESSDFDGAVGALVGLRRERRVPVDLVGEVNRELKQCQLMAARDRFDFDGALALTGSDPELLRQHGRQLRELCRAGKLLQGDEPWHERDVDGLALFDELLANARRRASAGRFDDAIGRLYRATELLAQVRLLRRFGIATSDVDVAAAGIPPEVRERLEGWRQAPRLAGESGRVTLGLVAAWQLLADLDEPLGTHFVDRKPQVLGWLDVRNRSLLAHGLRPVERATWDDVGRKWLAWLDDARAIVAACTDAAPRAGTQAGLGRD